MQLSAIALFISHSCKFLGHLFFHPVSYTLYRLLWLFHFLYTGSDWPMRRAWWEALPGFLISLCAEHSVYTRVLNKCDFCKHLETIFKSLLATTGICLELMSYWEVIFFEPLSYRNLVKPLGRIKHNPSALNSKTFLGKCPLSSEFTGEDRQTRISIIALVALFLLGQWCQSPILEGL